MNLQEKINKALELGKVEGAKKLLSEMYQQEDKRAWNEAKRAEYETIFPIQRDMTDDEKTEYDKQFSDENPKPVTYDEKGNEIPFVYPKVDIEYISIDEDGNEIRTPSNYQTFDEWINETKVVTPEVEEVSHTETIDGIETRTPSNYQTFDEWLNETKVVTSEVEEVSHTETIDGIETKVIDTPYQAEVTELVRPYVELDVTDRVDSYITSKYKELRVNEYPNMADYLDAIVKGDTTAKQEYIDKCLAVKAKYPKPQSE